MGGGGIGKLQRRSTLRISKEDLTLNLDSPPYCPSRLSSVAKKLEDPEGSVGRNKDGLSHIFRSWPSRQSSGHWQSLLHLPSSGTCVGGPGWTDTSDPRLPRSVSLSGECLSDAEQSAYPLGSQAPRDLRFISSAVSRCSGPGGRFAGPSGERWPSESQESNGLIGLHGFTNQP